MKYCCMPRQHGGQLEIGGTCKEEQSKSWYFGKAGDYGFTTSEGLKNLKYKNGNLVGDLTFTLGKTQPTVDFSLLFLTGLKLFSDQEQIIIKQIESAE